MESNKDAIRLKSVKHVDPHVETILDSAIRTALYSYEHDGESWTKPEVEGTLILYTREAPPHNMLLIINKMSKLNFLEPLSSNCEIQVKPPYLLIKSSKGNIYGIWFSDQDDVLRISNAINEIIQPEAATVIQPAPDLVHDPILGLVRGSPKSDIMSMLSHAHGVFESRRQESTGFLNTVADTSTELINPSQLKVEEPNTVADFFAKVGKGTTASAPIATSGVAPPSSTTNPVLQRLFQGAAAIGGQATVSCTAPISIPGTNSNLQSQGLGSLPSNAPMSVQELEGKLKENLHIFSVKDDPGRSPSTSLLSPQVFTSSQVIERHFESSILNQPNLMTPVTCLRVESNTVNGSQESLEEPLLSTIQSGFSPLTQEQLVQAFTTLLKKDDFVHQLHEAYVQALSRSLKGYT